MGKMYRVASFQIFLRDNKPKMNVYYPFLSQNQIMSKLKQQWKQLEFSERQSYSKLMIKTKASRMIKTTGRSSTKRENAKVGVFKNVDGLFMKDDGCYEFDSLCDDSHVTSYKSDHLDYSSSADSHFSNSYRSDDFDSPSANSPYMNNKYTIDSLNARFHSVNGTPNKSLQVHRLGKTYAGRVFELQQHIPKVSSEIMANFKNGILRTPCSKGRRTVQSHVSFSALKETLNVNENSEIDDLDIDEEILYVENTKTSKDLNRWSINANKVSEEMVYEVKSMKDDHPVHSCKYTPTMENELHIPDTKKPESKIDIKRTQTSFLASASRRTPCRFSRRIKRLEPDISPRATVCSRKNRSDESPHATKKLKLDADINCKKIFFKTNAQPVAKRHQVLSPAESDFSTRLEAAAGLYNRHKGQIFDNKRVIDIHKTVFSQGHKNGSKKSLHREHKLTTKLEKNANVSKSTFSPEAITNMIQSEAVEYTTKCTNNIRLTPSGRNKLVNLKGKPPGMCLRSTKRHDDFPVQTFLTRSLRSTSKKISKETRFEPHRKCFDVNSNECEINQEENESGTNFVEAADQNSGSSNEGDITDFGHKKHALTENSFYGINTITNLPLSSRKSKTLEKEFEGNTLKENYKSEKLECNKLVTGRNKTKCLNNAKFEKNINLVQEKDLLLAGTTETTDSKPFKGESSSLRSFYKNLDKGDCRFKMLKCRNGKTNGANHINLKECVSDKKKLNLLHAGISESLNEMTQFIPNLSVHNTFFEHGNTQRNVQRKLKPNLKRLSVRQRPISVFPEQDTDVKNYKSPAHVHKGTIVSHKPKRLFLERFYKSLISREGDEAADPYLENGSSEQNHEASETDQDMKENQDDFLSTITDQSNSALLQAIERLRNLSSPQMHLTEECLSDNLHSSDLSENKTDDDECVSEEKESLCHMFEDVTLNKDITQFTPAKQRLLLSSANKTSSNFTDMFDDNDIFL